MAWKHIQKIVSPEAFEGSPQLPERMAAARLRRRPPKELLNFGFQVKCAKNPANHASCSPRS